MLGWLSSIAFSAVINEMSMQVTHCVEGTVLSVDFVLPYFTIIMLIENSSICIKFQSKAAEFKSLAASS